MTMKDPGSFDKYATDATSTLRFGADDPRAKAVETDGVRGETMRLQAVVSRTVESRTRLLQSPRELQRGRSCVETR